MLGAIAGDVIGSLHEGAGTKTRDFPLLPEGARFTDDTVLTVAIAVALMEDRDHARSLREHARRHPGAGYGMSFARWAFEGWDGPYGSWGNGSAMRVSPVAWAFDDERSVLDEAAASAAVTHDHPEGIKGAQAIALATFRFRRGSSPRDVRSEIRERFGYHLERTLDEIRPGYAFDVSCQGSVPEALTAALEATGYEDAVRGAVSLGGDADTLAAMAGAVAEARFGGLPREIEEDVLGRLTPDLRRPTETFRARFVTPRRRRGDAGG